ncbi:MAG: hypothetical protein GC168_08445 [Candidatus Hydrogenedens sp.]|nr:hypothetical protein [Candidatus Hydrogenedens sp.]
MPAKPPLRLSRPDPAKGALQLDSPEFQAFVGAGRGGSDPRTPPTPPAPVPVKPTAAPKPVAPAAAPMSSPLSPPVTPPVAVAPPKPAPVSAAAPAAAPTLDPFLSGEDEPDATRAIGLRIPEIAARKLDRLAETWLCHRHQIMVDLLTPQLRQLAAAVERGEPPMVPAPTASMRQGRKRSITLRLRTAVADDLEQVVGRYGSIRSLVMLRLLVPAIESLYDREFGSSPSSSA